MRLSRQFIHAILAFVLLVVCFAYFFKRNKIPLIEVSKINSAIDAINEKDSNIKNLYLSFANAFTFDIVKKTDESNQIILIKEKDSCFFVKKCKNVYCIHKCTCNSNALIHKIIKKDTLYNVHFNSNINPSINKEEVSPSAHYPLIILERIFAFILISGIIIGRISTNKDKEIKEKENKIQYDVCYCIIINYAAYFRYRFKENIEFAFAKKGFLLPVFDYLMHCLECFNLGALIRFVSYKSGLKNVLIDIFILLKITFVLCCLQSNYNCIQYIIWYILLTNMFTYIYHDIWLECF